MAICSRVFPVLLAGIIVGALFAPRAYAAEISPQPENFKDPVRAKITEIKNVRQLVVEINGKEKGIELIGIKAVTSECYKNTPLKYLINRDVLLVQDPAVESEDDSIRAYVFLDEETLLNEELLVKGKAGTTIVPKNALFYDELTEAQLAAKKENLGVWKECEEKKEVLGASVVSSQSVIPPAGSLSPDVLFTMINNHRAGMGLPAFEKDAKLCEIAASRAPEIQNEIVTRTIHKGMRDRNLPFWITENMASYGSEQANFNWWLNSPLHRRAIEGTHKYSCGVCTGGTCAQLFTSWVPK